MELGLIKLEDLKFSGDIEDDRTNTYLELNDYDWMNYNLTTRFKTDIHGLLDIKFHYFGMNTSTMEIKQKIGKIINEYHYDYSANLFEKHIKSYLSKHIESWSSKYAFNGEELVLDFYNDVIQNGELNMCRMG